MGTAVRQGSKTMYYLDPAQAKAQQVVGGIKCIPVQGTSGRSRKTVYRMVPSSLQPGHVLQPVSGMTLANGLRCDSCPPQRRLQQVSSEDARYGGAVGTNEPQIVRLVPQGKNVFLEEVKPSPQLRRSRSTRQKLPNVMDLVEDRDWYEKVAAADTSESEAPFEPDTCPECMDELMRRRRAPYRETAVAASPVYVKKAPTSRRLCSRRISSPPQRTLSRGPSPSSSPRCPTCMACKSCGTVQNDSKPNTARSRSRKWYD
ncbi:hypothetical protein HPB50_023245 [Hyalomma asiaticum]|uniref:Uncharacterized protein n=1 Tax=Hyalomma asiaticum TaxID=266040 RepID=A0ACB7SBV2_HYAAI|nr:hypothetical protein HPB50_023245 [Hyalomma asiaticum]